MLCKFPNSFLRKVRSQGALLTRDGKEPSLLEFGSVGVFTKYQGSFGSGSFQMRKNKSSVRVWFFVQFLVRFGSVLCGFSNEYLLRAAQVRKFKF